MRSLAKPEHRNYANGDCQILAAAIQTITGWDVALFEGSGNHLTAVTPDGRHIDIHGIRTADEIATEWEADEPQIVGHIDNLGWFGCGWEAFDLSAAEQVLRRAGLLTEDMADTIAWEMDKLADEDEDDE